MNNILYFVKSTQYIINNKYKKTNRTKTNINKIAEKHD